MSPSSSLVHYTAKLTFRSSKIQCVASAGSAYRETLVGSTHGRFLGRPAYYLAVSARHLGGHPPSHSQGPFSVMRTRPSATALKDKLGDSGLPIAERLIVSQGRGGRQSRIDEVEGGQPIAVSRPILCLPKPIQSSTCTMWRRRSCQERSSIVPGFRSYGELPCSALTAHPESRASDGGEGPRSSK